MRTLGQRIFKHGAGERLRRPDVRRRDDLRRDALRLSALDDARDLGRRLGAGATQRLSAVRWGVAGNIVVAWVVTIPAAALVAAALYWPVEAIF